MAVAKKRKFWGWGFDDEIATADEQAMLAQFYAERFGASEFDAFAPPTEAEFDLPAPRLKPPSSLAKLCRDDAYERLVHAYGKSYPDVVRMFARDVPNPPDIVAYPADEADVAAILDWANGAGAAVIPFGGGSSVVGGVEPKVGDGYQGSISLDLANLDQVLEIDKTSRAARMQAGIRGPEIEARLKQEGLQTGVRVLRGQIR